jgi:hypothetical protein
VNGDQAKRSTKAHTQQRARELPTVATQKLISVSMRAQEMHHSSTAFPQLDLLQAAHYA